MSEEPKRRLADRLGMSPTDLAAAQAAETDRVPMKRFGNVDELAGAAIFLASDAASFVSGEILAVDGGFLASGVNQ